MRWKRRLIYSIIGLVIATIVKFSMVGAKHNPMVAFRNATDWSVLVVHEKQDRQKNYPAQKERNVVPPGGFAPFFFAPGDVFFAAFSDEPFDRDGEFTVRFGTQGMDTEYVEIHADQDDALLFVTGLEFPIPAP